MLVTAHPRMLIKLVEREFLHGAVCLQSLIQICVAFKYDNMNKSNLTTCFLIKSSFQRYDLEIISMTKLFFS